MANFSTIQDILQHALFRAGEFTAGSLADGDFYNGTDGGPVLRYVNDIVEGLLLGSPLGLLDESGRPMPAIDWWWARKRPNGVLFLHAPVTEGTVSIDQGTQTLTFSSLLVTGSSVYGTALYGSGIYGGPVDFTGYRIRIGDQRFVPRITSTDTTGAVTTAQIDSPWPGDSVTDGTYQAFQLEYDLPSDFLRFAGEPTLSADPYAFPVLDEDTVNVNWPIATITGGYPRCAALIGQQTIRLSHFPTQVDRVEFNYIYLPEKLLLSSTDLILPAHHRRVLAVGAAYYICYDKADTKAGDLLSEFRGLYRTMAQEHSRHQRKMSKGFGRINYRLGQVKGTHGGRLLRTDSGLIIGP